MHAAYEIFIIFTLWITLFKVLSNKREFCCDLRYLYINLNKMWISFLYIYFSAYL